MGPRPWNGRVSTDAGAKMELGGGGAARATPPPPFPSRLALSAAPEATTFLAIQRAMYEAERSTFVASLPENAPPPWRA